MSKFKQIYDLYNFNFETRIRTYQRWYCGTPYEYVEQFVPKQGNIIDIGCGWGMFSNLLALSSSERNVYGIDLDSLKIGWAKKTIKDRDNIKFDVQDLKTIKLDKINSIVIWDVLHHLEEETQFSVLEECYKKLSVGGKFILKENDVVPLWKYWASHFVEMIALGFNITMSKKILFRSRKEWKKLLEKYGFKVNYIEHIKTWHGFFVPHSLFVCEK
ncbi:class I SAM-dependent methyltransferase [bacterium]